MKCQRAIDLLLRFDAGQQLQFLRRGDFRQVARRFHAAARQQLADVAKMFQIERFVVSRLNG